MSASLLRLQSVVSSSAIRSVVAVTAAGAGAAGSSSRLSLLNCTQTLTHRCASSASSSSSSSRSSTRPSPSASGAGSMRQFRPHQPLQQFRTQHTKSDATAAAQSATTSEASQAHATQQAVTQAVAEQEDDPEEDPLGSSQDIGDMDELDESYDSMPSSLYRHSSPADVYDKVLLKNLKFYAHHGVYQHEITNGQPFEVDLELETDLTYAGVSDDIADTIDYGEVVNTVSKIFLGQHTNLLERLALSSIEEILSNFPKCHSVKISVRKPKVGLNGLLDYAGIEMWREREPQYDEDEDIDESDDQNSRRARTSLSNPWSYPTEGELNRTAAKELEKEENELMKQQEQRRKQANQQAVSSFSRSFTKNLEQQQPKK